jgi:hypothetical protein
MTRSQAFHTILSTATRILFERDPGQNRVGAYMRARHQAEKIALNNMRLVDAKRALYRGAPAQPQPPAAEDKAGG